MVESMYSGNATYIFGYEGHENLVKKDKQEIIRDNLAKERVFHTEGWEARIREILK